MAAHILFDSTINQHDELCGLCLQPVMMCRTFVWKGRGWCQPRHWHSAVIMCQFSAVQVCKCCLLIWKLSMFQHANNLSIVFQRWSCSLDIQSCLTLLFTAQINTKLFSIQFHVSMSKREGLKKIWNSHFKMHATRKPTKRALMMLSEAYSLWLALW